jgi:predicted nucleotide-binding protein (sugar kinase/HSP70/actin superfamily)
MNLRIGIPRALYYYRYFPLWNTFFERLGFEVVVSRPSHRSLVEEGFKFADDDTCIPIKMAYSHTLNIKGQVDFLFIPRLLSLELGTCFCPRLAGLPEMLRYSIPNLPAILSPYVDERYRNTRLIRSLVEMGSILKKSSKEIKQAYQKGEEAFQWFRKKMARGENFPDLFGKFEKENGFSQRDDSKRRIAVVGHPYCLYDPYFNFNLLKILREAKATIYTQEMVSSEEIDSKIQELGKDIYWTSGREILGASLHYLQSDRVDGLIYLTCFSCGIDSMIEPLVRHKVKEYGDKLYLCLMIDEHTGPTGVLTRVEAFLETMERKITNRRMG